MASAADGENNPSAASAVVGVSPSGESIQATVDKVSADGPMGPNATPVAVPSSEVGADKVSESVSTRTMPEESDSPIGSSPGSPMDTSNTANTSGPTPVLTGVPAGVKYTIGTAVNPLATSVAPSVTSGSASGSSTEQTGPIGNPPMAQNETSGPIATASGSEKQASPIGPIGDQPMGKKVSQTPEGTSQRAIGDQEKEILPIGDPSGPSGTDSANKDKDDFDSLLTEFEADTSKTSTQRETIDERIARTIAEEEAEAEVVVVETKLPDTDVDEDMESEDIENDDESEGFWRVNTSENQGAPLTWAKAAASNRDQHGEDYSSLIGNDAQRAILLQHLQQQEALHQNPAAVTQLLLKKLSAAAMPPPPPPPRGRSRSPKDGGWKKVSRSRKRGRESSRHASKNSKETTPTKPQEPKKILTVAQKKQGISGDAGESRLPKDHPIFDSQNVIPGLDQTNLTAMMARTERDPPSPVEPSEQDRFTFDLGTSVNLNPYPKRKLAIELYERSYFPGDNSPKILGLDPHDVFTNTWSAWVSRSKQKGKGKGKNTTKSWGVFVSQYRYDYLLQYTRYTGVDQKNRESCTMKEEWFLFCLRQTTGITATDPVDNFKRINDNFQKDRPWFFYKYLVNRILNKDTRLYEREPDVRADEAAYQFFLHNRGYEGYKQKRSSSQGSGPSEKRQRTSSETSQAASMASEDIDASVPSTSRGATRSSMPPPKQPSLIEKPNALIETSITHRESKPPLIMEHLKNQWDRLPKTLKIAKLYLPGDDRFPHKNIPFPILRVYPEKMGETREILAEEKLRYFFKTDEEEWYVRVPDKESETPEDFPLQQYHDEVSRPNKWIELSVKQLGTALRFLTLSNSSWKML